MEMIKRPSRVLLAVLLSLVLLNATPLVSTGHARPVAVISKGDPDDPEAPNPDAKTAGSALAGSVAPRASSPALRRDQLRALFIQLFRRVGLQMLHIGE